MIISISDLGALAHLEARKSKKMTRAHVAKSCVYNYTVTFPKAAICIVPKLGLLRESTQSGVRKQFVKINREGFRTSS